MPNRCHILTRISALVAIALAILLPVMPAEAVQDPRDRDLEVVQIDTSSHPEVTATISAPSALSARTLSEEAFRVTEGSKRLPVTVEAIDRDALEVILAVDPGAGDTGLRSVQGAALELINLTMPSLPLTVVAAGSPPTVVMRRSLDAAQATESIGALRPASEDRGDTLDALSLAMDQVDEQASTGTLVVLIAASATGSAAEAGELADRAGAAQIPFEVILPGEGEAPAAYASLDDLPSGNVIAAPATEDVVGALDRVTTDLAGRYQLRFRVSDATAEGPQPLIIGVDAYGIVAEIRVSVEGDAVTTPASTPVTATAPARTDGGDESGSGWLPVGLIAAALILILGLVALRRRDRTRIASLYSRDTPRPEPPSAPSPGRAEHVAGASTVIDLRDHHSANGAAATTAPEVEVEPEVIISFRPRQARAAATRPTRAGGLRSLLRRPGRARATLPIPTPAPPAPDAPASGERSRVPIPAPAFDPAVRNKQPGRPSSKPRAMVGPSGTALLPDGPTSPGATSPPQNPTVGTLIGQNGGASHPLTPSSKVLPAVEPTSNTSSSEQGTPEPQANGHDADPGDTGAPPVPATTHNGPQPEKPEDDAPASGLRGLLHRLRPTALEPVGSTVPRPNPVEPVHTSGAEPAPRNGRSPSDLLADPPTTSAPTTTPSVDQPDPARRSPAPITAPTETRPAPTIAKGPVRPRPQPEVIAEADKVDRRRPGARWWEYQRSDHHDETRDGPPSPEATPAGGPVAGVADSSGPPRSPNDPSGELGSTPADEPPGRADVNLAASPDQSLMPLFVLGGALLVMAIVVARFHIVALGPFLVPAGALVLAAAFGRRIVRANPDEQWVGRFIVYGVIAKLVASYARYLTLVNSYEGRGDAADYDATGRLLAKAWMGDGTAPFLYDLRKTNFVRWFTGIVYYLFGTNFMVGFFVFGLLALLGSYFWYRATVSAVPFIDKRLYLALVLFVPSIVFWPSSIGKESLMQLGIGTVTLGIALLMRTRLLAGLAVAVPGGWLLWVVRPHLLAMVAVSGGVAYAVGRVRQKDGATGSLLSRPAGIIVVCFLVIFTVSQGAQFLGLEELSLTSIENELDATTESTSQGGSEYDTGGNSLNPLELPSGAVTVLLRPFPWETDSPLQLLASAESALLAIALILRFSSLRVALSRSRTQPFLMYCWIVVAIYSATFSSFANFGLLVRQRSLVLPALYVLLAVKPSAARAAPASDDPVSGSVPRSAGVI